MDQDQVPANQAGLAIDELIPEVPGPVAGLSGATGVTDVLDNLDNLVPAALPVEPVPAAVPMEQGPVAGPAHAAGALPAATESPAATEIPDVDEETEDNSPVWTKAMERFAAQESHLYAEMKHRIQQIRDVDTDSWDAWSNVKGKSPSSSKSRYYRRCKVYLPPVKAVKSLAMKLSDLDPFKAAPLVTAGAFLAVEVSHTTRCRLSGLKAGLY